MTPTAARATIAAAGSAAAPAKTRDQGVTCLVRSRFSPPQSSPCFAAATAAASAATITVDTKSDAFDGNKCSLRDAIESANQNAKSGKCAKGSGTDTIVIPAGNYKLSITGTDEDANIDGDLDITSPMTLEGAGSGKTTIDGNGEELEERAIHVVDGDKVTVRDLTIRRGYDERHRRKRGDLLGLRRPAT